MLCTAIHFVSSLCSVFILPHFHYIKGKVLPVSSLKNVLLLQQAYWFVIFYHLKRKPILASHSPSQKEDFFWKMYSFPAAFGASSNGISSFLIPLGFLSISYTEWNCRKQLVRLGWKKTICKNRKWLFCEAVLTSWYYMQHINIKNYCSDMIIVVNFLLELVYCSKS